MRTILTCVFILACVACQQKATAPVPAVDTAADAQAIENAAKAQLAAIAARDVAGATNVYASDAVFIDDTGTASRGKDAINATFKGYLADPAMMLDFTLGRMIVSSGGDMAYSVSEFAQTYTDPTTQQPVTMKGTNICVWRKQADGSWKLVADGNPAGPAQSST
jgi:uncharacterized protein (TIGR02246 family)